MERGKKGHEVVRAPLNQTELDKGWGRGPPFLLPLPSFPFPLSDGRKEGAPPLPLVQFGLGLGGGAAYPSQPLSLSPKAQ